MYDYKNVCGQRQRFYSRIVAQPPSLPKSLDTPAL